MSNNRRGFVKTRFNKAVKGISLAFLVITITMAMIACSGKSKESIKNDTLGDGGTKEVLSPTIEPTTGPDSSIDQQENNVAGEPSPKLPEKSGSAEETKPTEEPVLSKKPTTTNIPVKETEQESAFEVIPSNQVIHSTTAFTHKNNLFYKTGKLTKTTLAVMDQRNSEVKELVTLEDSSFNNGDFYLYGNHIYYHENGDIYRIGLEGKNKTRLYKGTATILGIHREDIIALDRKARELIRISPKGDKKSLTKLNSIDSLEAVMVRDGIYYISKSSNNTLDGNDPMDRLYYIDLEGMKKTELAFGWDIYDLKVYEEEVYFLSITKEPEAMKVNRIMEGAVIELHSLLRKELQELGGDWFEANTFTLLGVNATDLFYGIDFNNGEAMNIYHVGVSGENHALYLNALDLEGINQAAYFTRGEIDGDYLKIIFDCDEAPVEIFLINLKDQSSIKLRGDYYIPSSIDVEGEYVYYCKSEEADRYGEMRESYEYGRSLLSKLQ